MENASAKDNLLLRINEIVPCCKEINGEFEAINKNKEKIWEKISQKVESGEIGELKVTYLENQIKGKRAELQRKPQGQEEERKFNSSGIYELAERILLNSKGEG